MDNLKAFNSNKFKKMKEKKACFSKESINFVSAQFRQLTRKHLKIPIQLINL